MKLTKLILFATIFIFLLSLVSATDITGCSVISSSGYYELTANITNSATSNCINITADNVFLDCLGNRIDGDDAADYGIIIYRASITATNITVQNCILSDWDTYAVYVYRAKENTFQNLMINSSPDGGMYLREALGSTVQDSVITHSGTDGIRWLKYAGTFSNILINDSGQSGVYVASSDSTDATYVNLTNITAIDGQYGITLKGDYHKVENCSFQQNAYGISIEATSGEANYNTIKNNEFRGNTRGLNFYAAASCYVRYNNVYNNYFNDTVSSFSKSGTTYPNNFSTTVYSSGNIIGGNLIGGNYWANPSGTGFSETCTDSEPDGICDNSYELTNFSYDYFPLAYIVAEPPSEEPNITGFDYDYGTTNFSAVSNLSAVPNMTLATANTKIVWTNDINAVNQDYSTNIITGSGFVSVNAAALDSSINSSAEITLQVAGCDTYTIYYASDFYDNFDDIKLNGQECNELSTPACTDIQCTGNTLTFTVEHFDGYGGEGGGAVPEFSTLTLLLTLTVIITGLFVIRHSIGESK